MIYALYHTPTETVGAIEDVLKKMNLPYREVHLYKGDGFPRDTHLLSGLIVMGGPMNVDDVADYPFLLEEVRLIEKLIDEKKPVLGICLGAQLIAKALGSKVYKNSEKEVGWHPIQLTEAAKSDPVFSALPQELTVLHWHGDTFHLPNGAVHLARSPRCENQAFRWGENTYALQFHLEVTPAMVTSWVKSIDGKKDVQDAGEKTEDILNQTPDAFSHLQPHAEKIFSDVFRLSYAKPVSIH